MADRLEKARELEARARELRLKEAAQDVDATDQWLVVHTKWGRYLVVHATPTEGHPSGEAASAVADRERDLEVERRAGRA